VWKAAHQDFTEDQTWAWCREGMTEAARLAGEFGITLALQNHKPVVRGYADTLRMVKDVGSPHLKICFDARLEHEMDEAGVRKALREIGPLQTLWHYGGEYDRVNGRIAVKGDEKALGEMLGLLDIGYRGYAGFELCHPLPVVDGKTVGLEFVDKNSQLAAEYMKGILAEAKKVRASET
jgi:sugar phosphate isomerase/epimerase